MPPAAAAGAKALSAPNSGLLTFGQLRCAAAAPCTLAAPKQVGRVVAGRMVRAKVLVPRRVGAGEVAEVKLKLGRDALARLAGHSARFEVRIVLRSGGARTVHVLEARVKRRQGAANGGGGGRSPYESGPISAEPPLLARPATAVDVGAVRLTWYPRDSWLRYASSGVGAGDGVFVGNGAVGTDSTASPCPDRPSSSDAQLPYTIAFAPRASWFDALSGTAGIYGQGSVRFRWKAHAIDLTASDPEIEINGAASRAIFRFSGSEGTPYPSQRADLLSLDLGGRPVVSGKTYTYDLMRGTLTANGVNVFAGFYPPPDNDEFGCVSVQFTTP
ncbi:MAG: HtaA domain-containing protein [Solirubrobacterales bacterium]